MSPDEEYLDDLLNSLVEGEEGDGFLPEDEGAAEDLEFGEGMLPEDLEFAAEDFNMEDLPAEDIDVGDFVSEDLGADDFALDDLGADSFISDGLESDNFALEDLGAEDLESGDFISEDLNMVGEPEEEASSAVGEETSGEEDDFSLDDFALEDLGEEELLPDDMGISDFQLDEDMEGEQEGLISPDDVDAMFETAESLGSDENIHEAETKKDDMFAFLDNMPEEESEEPGEIPDAVQEEAVGEDGEEETSKKKKKKEKKAKKEKKSLFGKKKKSQAPEGEEAEKESEEAEGESPEEEEKQKGFFSRLIAFLTEADDEMEEGETANGLEPSDENKNILKELDDEDKKKKKKKVKGKQGEDEEDGKGKKKKEKKEKKEKKKKEKPEPNPESELASETKKGKRVSVKSMIVIAGLCLTMTAMIIVMCSIIPAFFDKRAARDAFYESNYTKSYELLYGKERDENDDMIYHKSKTILEMRRKLDSYHNYMAIGKEVQALDALMSAVQSYPEILRQAEEFRVVQEVNAIYETILTILNDKYSLTEALAQTIIEYDDVTYTRRLESLVYNTPFVLPETQQESPAEDILPEERALMEEEEAAEAETGTAGEEAGMAEQGSEQDEFPMETEENDASGENPQEQDIEEQQPVEEQQPAEQEAVPEETAGQTQSSSLGEDVSTWTEESGFGSQGEQIQGIRQPIGIEIHGN